MTGHRELPTLGRALLEEWPEIGFLDDRDGCLYTAMVRRTAAARSVESSVESSGKNRDQILDLPATRADLTIVQVAQTLGLSTRTFEKQIVKLQQEGCFAEWAHASPSAGKSFGVVERSEAHYRFPDHSLRRRPAAARSAAARARPQGEAGRHAAGGLRTAAGRVAERSDQAVVEPPAKTLDGIARRLRELPEGEAGTSLTNGKNPATDIGRNSN